MLYEAHYHHVSSLRDVAQEPPLAPYPSQIHVRPDMALNVSSSATLEPRKAVRLYTRPHSSLPGFFTIQHLPPTPPSTSTDRVHAMASTPIRSFTSPAVLDQHRKHIPVSERTTRSLTPSASPQLDTEHPQDIPRYPSACSSYADTFVTAQEDVRSVANRTPLLPWSEDDAEDEPTQGSDADKDSPEPLRATAATPTMTASTSSSPRSNHLDENGHVILSPNVTVRRRIRPKRNMSSLRRSAHEDEMRLRSSPSNLTPEQASPTPVTRSARDTVAHVSEDEHVHGQSPAQVNDALYSRMRDEKSKRLSAVSTTSTTVSVMVRDTRPKPTGALRRARKNVSLGTDFSEPAPDSSPPTDTDAVHSNHHLRHSRSIESLRNAAKRTSIMSDDPNSCFTNHLDHETSPGHDGSNARVTTPPSKGHTGQKLDRDLTVLGRSREASIQTPDADRHDVKPQPTARRAIARSPTYTTDQMDVALDEPCSQGEVGPVPPTAVPRLMSPFDSDQGHEHRRDSLQQSEHRSSRPVSALGADSQSPGAVSPGLLHPNTNTALTPQSPSPSLLTGRMETLEVTQATAINITSHNTNSVTIVDRGSRSKLDVSEAILASAPRRAYTDGVRISQSSLTRSPPDEASNNGMTRAMDLQAEPLQTSSHAPVIMLCPATPAPSEISAAPAVHEAPPRAPTRRSSLIDRARRYSDMFAQPLFGRSSSVRPDKRNSVPQPDKNLHLHPEWRPRYLSYDRQFLDRFTGERNKSHLRKRLRQSFSHTRDSIGRASDAIRDSLRGPGSVEEVYKGPSRRSSRSGQHLMPTSTPHVDDMSADVSADVNENQSADVEADTKPMARSRSSQALPSPVDSVVRAEATSMASHEAAQHTQQGIDRNSADYSSWPASSWRDKELPPLPDEDRVSSRHPSLRRRKSKDALRASPSVREEMARAARHGRDIKRETCDRSSSVRLHKIPGMSYGIQIEGLDAVKNKLKRFQRGTA